MRAVILCDSMMYGYIIFSECDIMRLEGKLSQVFHIEDLHEEKGLSQHTARHSADKYERAWVTKGYDPKVNICV